jgi:hypothetical protein
MDAQDVSLMHKCDEAEDAGGGDGGGDVIGGDGDDGDVRVRSAEGEVVAWSRSAAARSAALANWVSDTGGAEGAFATLVPAAALRTLSRVAEGGAEDGRVLEGCSLAQLAQLLHDAHFLDVDVELLQLLSRTLCTGHLAGKSGQGADVPTLCALKGVSLTWRARARRVLCARLCARVGLPLTSNLVEVTDLDLSGSRAAGAPVAWSSHRRRAHRCS